jgi:hypothetical protein
VQTLLKVLTLKATQRLLLQLQELDMFKAQVGRATARPAG